jgi:hypothetical protein
MELRVREVGGELLGISATFGPKAAAAIRGGSERLTCRIEPSR